MADNKKWFKVWTTIMTDPSFDDIHNQAIGVWIRLGALVALHGINGQITISKQQFKQRAHIQNETKQGVDNIIAELAKINVKIENKCNDTCFVSFSNWGKYQTDWNSYERVKKFRERQNETVRETVQDKKRSRREVEVDKKEDKDLYGELQNVKLTKEEYQKFIDKFGSEKVITLIERLSLYIASKGDKYKSHYATILNWVKKDEINKPKSGADRIAEIMGR